MKFMINSLQFMAVHILNFQSAQMTGVQQRSLITMLKEIEILIITSDRLLYLYLICKPSICLGTSKYYFTEINILL